jgi:uncharacterized membrane protein
VTPLAFASLAALAYGVSDFYGGLATRKTDAFRVVAWSQLAGLAMLLIAAPLFGGSIGVSDATWAVLAGLAGAVGLVALYRGLSTGSAAIVSPLAGVLSGIVPAVAGFALGERPSPVTLAGFGLAVAAVWLVSGGRVEAGSGFWLGVLAGTGFGLFFVFLSPIPEAAGLWPLVPARIASIVVLSGLIRQRARPGASLTPVVWAIIAAVGIGDTLANVFMLLAIQQGPLGESAVISSLSPAVTVALTALVLRERVRRWQWVGLALAVAAMSLIAG